MTYDSEKPRATDDLQEIRARPQEWRSLGHRAVTEGVNLKYVDQMRKALYAAADEHDALLARVATLEEESASYMNESDTWQERSRAAEARNAELTKALERVIETHTREWDGAYEAQHKREAWDAIQSARAVLADGAEQ